MKSAFLLTLLIPIFALTGCKGGVVCKAGDPKIDAVRWYLNKLHGDIALYEVKNGSPPTTQQGLSALVAKPAIEPIPLKWRQGEKEIERDPWEMEYQYEYPGKHNKKGFDIFSSGPDRTPGTADDIGNWSM